MTAALKLIPEMTSEQFSLWLWVVGIGTVLSLLLLFVRHRPCVHDLNELDSIYGIIRSKCRKCGKEIYHRFENGGDCKQPASEPDDFVIPALQLTPGSIYCLHLPHGFDREKALEYKLRHMAEKSGLKAVICKPAGSTPEEDPNIRLTRTWFAQAAGVSEKKADEIIAALPISLDRELNRNAGTPRSLLGIAAGLTESPDVIIYDTTALDHGGVRDVNRFVRNRCRGKAVVHLSHAHGPLTNNPIHKRCPPGAKCFEIA